MNNIEIPSKEKRIKKALSFYDRITRKKEIKLPNLQIVNYYRNRIYLPKEDRLSFNNNSNLTFKRKLPYRLERVINSTEDVMDNFQKENPSFINQRLFTIANERELDNKRKLEIENKKKKRDLTTQRTIKEITKKALCNTVSTYIKNNYKIVYNAQKHRVKLFKAENTYGKKKHRENEDKLKLTDSFEENKKIILSKLKEIIDEENLNTAGTKHLTFVQKNMMNIKKLIKQHEIQTKKVNEKLTQIQKDYDNIMINRLRGNKLLVTKEK
ncbi:MAG: hypothetical protein MJ252_30310 [archaeon]|nr:hypothetical protein [archaeon]